MSDHHVSGHICGPLHPHDHTINLSFAHAPGFRLALILVIILNASMFVLEIMAGHFAASQALMADALDFLGDTLTYTLTFVVLGMAPVTRARAAVFKGITLVLMAAYVLSTTLYQVFVLNLPEAFVMTAVGVLALLANALSVLLLYRFRQGDANIRSAWLCSRNDMLGNVAVVVAAIGVFGTGTAWPDLIVAALMAGLFIHSAQLILRQALYELRHTV